MAKGFQLILCMVLCVATCSAHLCLINPNQRGSITGINNPGIPIFILSYCYVDLDMIHISKVHKFHLNANT